MSIEPQTFQFSKAIRVGPALLSAEESVLNLSLIFQVYK